MPKSNSLKLLIAIALVAAILLGGYFAFSQYKDVQEYKLLASVSANDLKGVRASLASGVNVNLRFGGDGDTPLHRAAALASAEMTQLLLKEGADPNIANEQNETPLLTAAYRGRLENARLLISADAKIDTAESRYKMTPLIAAAWKGHRDLVKLLLESGASLSMQTIDGKTALDEAKSRNDVALISMLEEAAQSRQPK